MERVNNQQYFNKDRSETFDDYSIDVFKKKQKDTKSIIHVHVHNWLQFFVSLCI